MKIFYRYIITDGGQSREYSYYPHNRRLFVSSIIKMMDLWWISVNLIDIGRTFGVQQSLNRKIFDLNVTLLQFKYQYIKDLQCVTDGVKCIQHGSIHDYRTGIENGFAICQDIGP